MFIFIIFASHSFASPQISCSVPVYNFGSLTNAPSVEHTFIINNNGDEPLEISKVRGCCGASTFLRDKVIPPGSNTTLKVMLSLKGRHGKVNKSVYVVSNDLKTPYFRLKMSGNALSTGVITQKKGKPKKIIIGDIITVPKEVHVTNDKSQKKPVIRYVALRSRKHATFKITDVKLPVKSMTYNLTTLGNAGWRIKIANIIPDDKLNGKNIVILTDRKDQSAIAIPILVIKHTK